jgi:transcriptional regulator with XRE-family HTH domain
MKRKIPPTLNQCLSALRLPLGWSQQELAQASGIPANLISDYERGRKALSRKRLEQLAAAMGLPAASVDTAMAFVKTIHASWQTPGPDDPDDWRIEALAAEAGRLSSDYTRATLKLQTNGLRAVKDRYKAEALWERLKTKKTLERRILVEHAFEFRNWALCERVCEESEKAAADNADRAIELAELALYIAERSPGDEGWRSRLQGYAWAHLGNARRVRNDLPSAEEAFTRSRKLWEVGASSTFDFLDEALVLDLEASLRRAQRRLPEALELLDRALFLPASNGKVTKNLLINKGNALLTLGDFEGAVRVLRQAAPLVEAEGEPRSIFALRFNLAVNLCFLGQYKEAKELLPELHDLAARIGNGLDLTRLHWLQGRIASGLGERERAILALSRVREDFASRGLALDTALVCLELAVLYLEEKRTAEVKIISRQLAPIFQVQGVHREALAALKLFREAAEREAVTLDLARRIVQYLQRAQYNPELKFEDS